MNLKQFLLKIGNLGIIVAILFSNGSFGFVEEAQAIGRMRVIVGTHEHSQSTNMVVRLTLGDDITCDATYKFILHFGANVVDAGISADDIKVMRLDSGGDEDITAYFGYNSTFTTLNEIAFQRNNIGGCTTLSTDDEIAFYIGHSDDAAAGYVTGEDDYFNPLATNVIQNPAAGTELLVNSSGSFGITEGNDGIYASYPLVADNDYVVDVNVATHITLNITDAELLFGNMVPGEFIGDTAAMKVSTNYSGGYTLRYRATEFSNGTTSFLRADGGALQDGEWGINLADNTASSYDIGIFPQDENGVDLDSEIGASYKISDSFYVQPLDTFGKIIVHPAPAYDVISLSAVLLPSNSFTTGVYKGTITVNVYAMF